jgi:hypothetical protein
LRARAGRIAMHKSFRNIVACCVAGLALHAGAHDLLTAESVQAYLAKVANLQKMLVSGSAVEARAQASLQLGQTLDEIRELFNRDIEAHGKVQGLASSVLMSELTARDAPLAYSERANRFTANLPYYRDALRWAPSGPIAADASFQLLKGYFYDSIGDDPLQPIAQSRTQLAEQIRLGEALERDFPRHTQREEATFILAIHYMQAARVTEARERTRFLVQARETTARFVKAYPDSLRAATLAALLESASGSK